MAIAQTHSARPRAHVTFSPLGSAVSLLADWDARYRARRNLETLSSERRTDLGLSARDIDIEVSKPVWRA